MKIISGDFYTEIIELAKKIREAGDPHGKDRSDRGN